MPISLSLIIPLIPSSKLIAWSSLTSFSSSRSAMTFMSSRLRLRTPNPSTWVTEQSSLKISTSLESFLAFYLKIFRLGRS
ncbi:hypothetical protein HanHA300_Chr15g0575941 [Helianthus annuus]|nr:hypothetical protein HanHA300_Chr15g0575941 [Helianthus annuus]KAJ0649642.1 hypothetical protein HanLR1_Chr15g0586641 [Helianthus annuus]KAJ0653430.1 hypothetical protein HanOQP8_Chr15g0583491 [Helianthus annuus]